MSDFYIRFSAPVNQQTCDQLQKLIDQNLARGIKRFHLLLNTSGGSVQHGLGIYNALKGIPAEVYTYNYSQVDSIGVVIFCAGTKRFTVPNARFLLHKVQCSAGGNFEEYQLQQLLDGLRTDHNNIANVISSTCNIEFDKVTADMNRPLFLDSNASVTYGLTHEIKAELIPPGAAIVNIGFTPMQNQMIQIPQPIQMFQ